MSSVCENGYGEDRIFDAVVDMGADEITCQDTSNQSDWNFDGVINYQEYAIIAAAWLSHDPNDPAGWVRLVDDLNTSDTGSGGPPVVDMGAYEFQGCDGNTDAISGVNLLDVALLGDHWMQTDCGICGGADLDGDHNVGMGDLLVQATNWLCGL